MNRRSIFDFCAWALSAVAIGWVSAWGYINTFAGDHPPAWVASFEAWHAPLFSRLPDLPPAWALIAALSVLALYFLPAFVASGRQAPSFPMIAGVNLLLGWTLLGWLAAMLWAVFDRRRPASA